jgi:ferredoxin
MKVSIDRADCTSCGTCWATCPAFFEENLDDHLSQVVKTFRPDSDNARGAVPEELEACVQEAADLCPVQVISTGA